MLSPMGTNSVSALVENQEGKDTGTDTQCQGEVPGLSLEPTVMKEFSFLGIFAYVLGCAAKLLPTHLYANESSHMLGISCPQIQYTKHRRLAWLLQNKDLR